MDQAFPLRHAAAPAAPAFSPDQEAALVRRAVAEPAAFGELYEAHYHAILNYLYRRTLSITLAEELTSNTFFNALRALPGFQPRPSVGFRAWLYRIATNEVRMHWRSRAGRPREMPLLTDEKELPRITFVWPEMEPAEVVREKQARFEMLHQALGRLPEPYQTVIVLRYFEGLGNEEIGSVLGKRVGTVKSLVHRGIARLAKAIGEIDATV